MSNGKFSGNGLGFCVRLTTLQVPTSVSRRVGQDCFSDARPGQQSTLVHGSEHSSRSLTWRERC
ncbi:hypothetical protein P3T23_005152 [Paraburkholderia sp. GAS448]